MHVITCTFCGQPSYINRNQRLNFKCNSLLYFGAVLIGLFDQHCVDAVISINYLDSLLGNIVCTIES